MRCQTVMSPAVAVPRGSPPSAELDRCVVDPLIRASARLPALGRQRQARIPPALPPERRGSLPDVVPPAASASDPQGRRRLPRVGSASRRTSWVAIPGPFSSSRHGGTRRACPAQHHRCGVLHPASARSVEFGEVPSRVLRDSVKPFMRRSRQPSGSATGPRWAAGRWWFPRGCGAAADSCRPRGRPARREGSRATSSPGAPDAGSTGGALPRSADVGGRSAAASSRPGLGRPASR